MRGTGILITDGYDLQVDPKMDSEGKISSGLVIGHTLYQNQALILILQPGEIKLNPITGVGIENIVADHDYLAWRRKIRQQMELDQQTVKISFSAKKELIIDGGYKN